MTLMPSPRTCRIALLVGLVIAVPLFLGAPVDIGLREAAEALTRRLHDAGIMIDIRYGHVEAAANVALFIPLGFLLAGATRRWWVGVLGGFALSAAVESLQFALLASRQASLRDLIANTLGALLGAGLAGILLAASRRRGARSTSTSRRATRSDDREDSHA